MPPEDRSRLEVDLEEGPRPRKCGGETQASLEGLLQGRPDPAAAEWTPYMDCCANAVDVLVTAELTTQPAYYILPLEWPFA
jgi:hypothetical protein